MFDIFTKSMLWVKRNDHLERKISPYPRMISREAEVSGCSISHHVLNLIIAFNVLTTDKHGKIQDRLYTERTESTT